MHEAQKKLIELIDIKVESRYLKINKNPTKYKFSMSEKYPIHYDHEEEKKHEKRNRS